MPHFSRWPSHGLSSASLMLSTLAQNPRLPLNQTRLDGEDFREQPVALCGKVFIAHWSGALYWPAEDALIISDLHLGEDTPLTRTHDTLARLAAALDMTPASTVIALGDGLSMAAGRLAAADLDVLRILQEERDWIWITGDTDRTIAQRLGGHVLEQLTVSGLTLRTVPALGRVTHEIAGHLHPAARVSRRGHTVLRPCFAGNGRRLILPAFGAPSGGLNILDAAFEPLFGHDGMQVWMLGHEGLYPVATRLLRSD